MSKIKLTFLVFLCLVSSVAFARADENQYCAPGDKWVGPTSDGPAQLPNRCIYTRTQSPGVMILVPATGNLQAAIDSAKCGDTILLAAGATYSSVTLPAKHCDVGHWINIRSGAPDSALPHEHVRINPSYAGVPSLPDRPPFSGGTSNVMATIITPDDTPAIEAQGADHYRLGPGLEITRKQRIGTVHTVVDVRGADHIILDRDWIHGSPLVEETKVGVHLGGATSIAVINSYMNDFKCLEYIGTCTDAQDIVGGDGIWSHPEGVWKAYNNFLEAAGENILHGGQPFGNQTPYDLEYRENHFYKPPTWRTCTIAKDCYIVKNLFELKNAARVLLEDNMMEGSWGGYTQSGFAILLTPRGSWSHVDNVTIRYNHISHVAGPIMGAAMLNCHHSYLRGHKCPTHWEDSAGAGFWSFHDLLFDDVDPFTYIGFGTTQLISQFKVNPPLHDVAFDHMTVITKDTKIFSFFVEPSNPKPKMGPFRFMNSIVIAGKYNIWSTGGNNPCVVLGDPIKTFNRCFTTAKVTHNLIIGWTSRPRPPWPAGNQYPVGPTEVFTNFQLFGGDYHILAPYKNAGTDGKDLGADIDAISQRLAGVE